MRKLDVFERLVLKHMNGSDRTVGMSETQISAVIPAVTRLDHVMSGLFMGGMVTRHGDLWRITGDGIESLLLGGLSE